MQVGVKTPHIEINVKGSEIPPTLLEILKKEYGEGVCYLSDSDDELVDIEATDWYKDINAKMTPGDYVKIYRENRGITQEKLGKMLGDVPRQNISSMERGTRPISLKMARKLSSILGVPLVKIIGDERSEAGLPKR
jgi:DNA-binding XRE family transcriptional regulator